MTSSEQMYLFKKLTEVQDDVISSYYLNSAKSIVLQKAYPYDEKADKVPSQYMQIQLDIAIYLYNRAGSEGEVYHKENGIDRGYESGDVPPSMLRRITPHCGVLGGDT